MKHTWRNWLALSLARAKKRSGGCRQHARPTLEILEDRTMLSGVSPFVQSINRAKPAAATTSAASVTYNVLFNEAVTGVASNDFTLVLTGTVTATVSQVTPVTASAYTVTVNAITGTGTLGLNLVDNGTIRDLAGDGLVQPNAPASFQAQSVTNIFRPYGVAVADVNGDGKPDLVVTHYNGVGVLLGNGDGTFQSLKSFAAGMYPNSVAVADLNGDGKADIIVDNLGSNSISVLLGNGNGTFQSQSTLATGTVPWTVTVADVNNDSKPDLIVTNSGDNDVGVLLGNGNGTFQNQTTFASGKQPESVAVADVNGDGKPDLVVSNFDGTGVSVLLGNGNGTFQKQTSFAAGKYESAVAVADVNGDGNADLIVINYNTRSVSVLLGNGTGAFQSPTSFATDSQPRSLAVADINGDGKVDLITGNAGGQGVSVLLGNGDGTFQDQTAFATDPFPFAVAVADVNSDGKPDIITANSQSTTVTVLLNAANGDFTGQVYKIVDVVAPFVQSITRTSPTGPATNLNTVQFTVTFSKPVVGVDTTAFTLATTGTVASALLQVTPVSATVYTVTVSGITGSGTLGLNLVDNNTIHDLAGNPLAQGSGIASFQTQIASRTDFEPHSVAVGDLNGDGITDVVTANVLTGDVSVLLGNNSGFFPTFATYGAGSYPSSVALADLTGDGKLDLVVSNFTPGGIGSVSVLLGNGDGTFQSQMQFATGPGPLSVAVADLNGDGIPDIVTANRYSGNLSVLLGNGNGTFQSQTNVGAGLEATSVTVADVNGDGKPDLVFTDYGFNQVDVLLGNGDGTFQSQTNFATGSSPVSVTAADLNGDGNLDLIVANRGNIIGGTVSVLLGNGDGTFQSPANFAAGTYPNSVTVADVNGDGNADLVIADDTSTGAAIVLLGNGDGTFPRAFGFPAGLFASDVAVADVNGDNRPDLIVASQANGSISVLLNAEVGNFTGQVYNIVDPAVPTQFVISAGPSSVAAGGNATFTVTAEDQFNEISYAYTGTVTFTSSDSLASFLPTQATLVSGIGTFTATLRTAGSQTLIATDNNTSGVTGIVTGTSNSVLVIAGPATHFSIAAAGTALAGTVLTFTVTALDRFNNVATNYTGTVTLSANDAAALSSDSTLTNSVGTFFVVWTKVGNKTLTATDTVNGSITGSSGSIVVRPALLRDFVVSTPAGATVGTGFSFTVTAQDQFQNTIFGYGGTVHFTSSDGAAILPADATLTNGSGMFSATLNSDGSQTLVATDTTSTSATGSSAVTVVGEGSTTHFMVQAIINSVAAGGPVVLRVTAEDQFNNTATRYAGVVHLTSTDTQAGLTSDAPLSNGTSFFGAVLKTAGNQTIIVSDTAVSSITGASGSISVSAAAADHLAITTGLTAFPGIPAAYPNTPAAASSFVSAGVPFAFTVAAEDPYGNVSPSYSGTVAFASSDKAAGVVLPATGVLTGGIGTFSATLVTAGSQTITATDINTGSITGHSSAIVTRGLVVTSFTPTPSGFTLSFNKPFNASAVNLYSTSSQALPDDVILATTLSQVAVRGTALINATDTGITFVKTASVSATGTFNPGAGLLVPGKYTVTLRAFTAGSSGFEDALGGTLDGSDTGQSGTNYQITFIVAAPPVAVGIPDFARGPSNTDSLIFSTALANGSTFNLSYTNPAANPTTATATVTFSTTAATLLSNIQTALTSGGLATQIGSNASANGTPNAVTIVTTDNSAGANVLITFQSTLAQATSQLLNSATPGVSIAAATIDAANNVPGTGIPIALSSGQNVTSGSFTLQYNPNLLTISGAVSKIAGASFTLVSNDTVAGTAVLSFSSPSSISSASTAIILGSLQATVPMSALAVYGSKQLLHFSSAQLNGTAGPIAVTNQDGVMVAAYLGDVTGTGGPFVLHDATDIAAVAGGLANTATQTIPGFAAFPNVDPAIIGDVSLQGTVNFTDAGAMTQELGGTARVTIPYAPIGLSVTPISPQAAPGLASGQAMASGGSSIVAGTATILPASTNHPLSVANLHASVVARVFSELVQPVASAPPPLGNSPAPSGISPPAAANGIPYPGAYSAQPAWLSETELQEPKDAGDPGSLFKDVLDVN
jgi:FG-GAP-like repeat/FG-GAP repeat